jgi:hypothetical protein
MKIRNPVSLALLAFVLLSPVVNEHYSSASLHRCDASVAPAHPRRPDTPFERTLRRAWNCRSRALLAVARELEALDSRDPDGMGRVGDEQWRRPQLARDRSGDLHRAQHAAQEAVSLARTPGESYRATVLLTWIESDLGCHAAELQQARRLMSLAPDDPRSLIGLQRALMCNGLVGQDRYPGSGERSARSALEAGLPEPGLEFD